MPNIMPFGLQLMRSLYTFAFYLIHSVVSTVKSNLQL